MSTDNFIYCPGCENIVAATRGCCPGCGRCLGCGDRRGHGEEYCPRCDVPYCTHCGKCAVCSDFRYTTLVEPCPSCGHPQNAERLKKLIQAQGLAARSER